MPLSERRELTDRPDTDDTDEAVDTERSSAGIAPRARVGVTQGSGEPARSCEEERSAVSSVAMFAVMRVRNGREAKSGEDYRLGRVGPARCRQR